MGRVAFVLGKPPRPRTLLAEVADLLATRNVAVSLFLPHEQPVAPASLATGADLVVHRGLDAVALDLVREVETRGVPTCNPVAGVDLVADRHALARRLEGAGIPAPTTTLVTSWSRVRAQVTGASVLKARHGQVGRGAGVVRVDTATLPREAPFPGPWLVQPFVPNDGTDVKLYVAGGEVAGLRKPSPLGTGHVRAGRAVDVSTADAEVARAVGTAVGLEIFGVDLLATATGPVVIDVNPFPGFRGVAAAPRMVTDHIETHLDGGGPARPE